MAIIQATRDYKLIYVFEGLYSPTHVGLLKVGEATVTVPESKVPEPNDEAMNQAATIRIIQEVGTVGFQFKLLYTEVAYYVDAEKGGMRFNDHDVHDVLENSGYKHHEFPGVPAREWFPITLDIAKQAIKAVKEQRQALDTPVNSKPKKEIKFRREQNDAIAKTLNYFNADGKKYLWNAKMRFGKTLCALEVVRRMECKRTLILTHRPAVRAGWFEDFENIKFHNYQRGAKYRPGMSIPEGGLGQNLVTMERDLAQKGTHYIYFMSMQDLRGSTEAGGKFIKNDDVFDTNWDLIILDEAHEGTLTTLGKNVIKKLKKTNTKWLYLSGTPYNILHLFQNGEIYTWDYVMEQKAKADWYEKYPHLPNPYEELPRLNMLTYKLGNAFEHYQRTDKAYFNFSEFFRVWTIKDLEDEDDNVNITLGDFVHKDDVRAFLDLLTKDDPDSNYPFANEEYRNYFKHSFWIVPGVKEAAALTTMLENHPTFKNFKIVNVAGDGNKLANVDADSDVDDIKQADYEKTEAAIKDALVKVKTAIKENPRTITISCGRLTTGITVPEWTAVLMLHGAYDSKAATYLQTIFRVQSPAKDGTIKRECYAFDFAPDRTITVVEEHLNVMRKLSENKSGSDAKTKEKGHHTDKHLNYINDFLKFCPIIAVEGSQTRPYDTTTFMTQVHRALAEQINRRGFNDHRLFMGFDQVSPEDLALLNGIESLFGKASKSTMSNEGKVTVNDEGMTPDPDDPPTGKDPKEDNKKREKPKAEKKPRNNYAESLRRYRNLMTSIAKRFPLLLFGAVDELDRNQWSLRRFVEGLDPEDWAQFMPNGFTKEKFLEVEHIFNNDFFITSTLMLLEETHEADKLPVKQRAARMAQILQRFHYPDKETVLTPWRVVNLHMATTLGGYSFYKADKFTKELQEPILCKQDGVTDDVFDPNSKLLEINSKSGVYPLWLAYTLFRYRCAELGENLSEEDQRAMWDLVIGDQLFVFCKTAMASLITRRVLAGYRKDVVTHCKYERNLNDILKDENKRKRLVNNLMTPSYWNITNMANNRLFFRAVVGNPPYQGDNHWQLYPNFYLLSRQLGHFSSLIFPTGWQLPKTANNLRLMNTEDVKADPQIRHIDNRQNIFQGVAGAEWVNIVFWENDYDNGLNGQQRFFTNGANEQIKQLATQIDDIEKPLEIRSLVDYIRMVDGFMPVQDIMSMSKPYGLRKDVFGNWDKYGLTPMSETKTHSNDISIYGKNGIIMYAPRNYDLPKVTNAFTRYKVFVATAWGNMSESKYLGGAYSDVVVAAPYDVCTETYQESGCFNDKETAVKHAKYLMTNFARAALYNRKISQMTTQVWGDVPVQDYSEPWWNESIAQINEHLFDKYNVPQPVRDYVNAHIQPRTEDNIRNL